MVIGFSIQITGLWLPLSRCDKDFRGFPYQAISNVLADGISPFIDVYYVILCNTKDVKNMNIFHTLLNTSI
ncbi:MAG: hypothetical protein HMLIMOIP_000783 [Candidatus Nitrosomirales archaeon]|jgi:hypothetical protein